jgi:hypothetical protein
MLTEAAAAGFYESPNGKKHARVQLLTIDDLLNGTQRADHPDYTPDLEFHEGESGDRRRAARAYLAARATRRSWCDCILAEESWHAN